ncbi:MAG: adenylate/guanylate cyclase domain-containing protein [Rhodospirillales bacterium]|nr:adenylate/guanylate cyclase domain-containing protein [Rhodospirillales bacterium]
MNNNSLTHKLAAILAADVAGYSRLMNEDEAATISAWQNLRSEIIKPVTAEHSGRIVKHTGDGFLAEFQTVSDAVRCAIAMQFKMSEFNEDIAEQRRLNFRMGINFGEIVVDEDDIHGDGVNVAARLEGLASEPGICVTSQVYEQVRKKVGCAFEDMGEHQVKNIAEQIHVYRILCSVPAPRLENSAVAADPAGSGSPRGAMEKPSIAVLPFVNMSADPEQEFFADGLTEDILTQLSRFADLFVISRNSTFTYKGKSVKAKDVANDLGVRYVVEGSVRKAGNRVRVTVQLIDGNDDRHVWAEKYDRELEDIFDIQDEITAAITATLPGRIEADSHDRARRKPTENMQAYECVLAGKILHHKSNREDNIEAQRYLERAIELDPNYVHARAWRACVLGQAWGYGWLTGDYAAVLSGEMENLEKMLAIDENDTDTHRILAAIYITRLSFDQALAHQTKALALNPNYDLVVVQQGELLTWLGRAEEGIDWIKKAMKLNPFHPQRFWSHLGRAYFVVRRYEDAIAAFKHIDAPDGTHYAFLAACSSYLDDSAVAAEYNRETLNVAPDFNISAHMALQYYSEADDRAHHLDGLRKAGFAEGS